MGQDITEDEKARLYGPAQVVFLDPEKTTVEIADDRYGLFLVVSDGKVTVHLELPREPKAGALVSKLGRDIVNSVPEVRSRTLGYQVEHNAHTGPGVFRPIPRPLGPPLMQQDPPGWT